VDYLSAVDLSDEQESFFKKMIAESSKGTKYKFVDKENVPLFVGGSELIGNISDGELFLNTSKQLAQNFKATHDNRMSDGILIVTVFSMLVNEQPKNFLAILKVDYEPVLQQIRDSDDSTKVTFQEITDSLLEDKKALQKRALVDVSDAFDWDVIAVERAKTVAEQDTEGAIGKHFKNFLSVTLLENNSTLTRKVIAQTKRWADGRAELNPSDVRARVIKYIEAHDGQSVNLDDIRDVICEHEDQEIKTVLMESFNQHMDDESLTGVQFLSRANSIPDKERRTKLKTNTNVILEWRGEMADVGITRERINGQEVFTIAAERVDELS
jgi:hypothetical protein